MGAVRSKIRLYDLAKDLRVDTKRLIQEVRSLGVDVSIPSNSITKEVADKIRLKHSAKKVTAIKQSSKLTYKPFLGPLANSRSVAIRGYAEQNRALRAASKQSSTERLGGRQKKSIRKRHKAVRRNIQLVYNPPETHLQRPPQTKVRMCVICSGMCPSKADLRNHIVETHMNEVMTGRVLCRVTADELCQATKTDLTQVTAIAIYMGCKIKKESDYVPARISEGTCASTSSSGDET